MDKLLAKLSEQQAVLHQNNEALKSSTGDSFFTRSLERTASLPITPATDVKPGAGVPTARPASATPSEQQAAADEVNRLKLELEQAQNKISHLEAQTRLTDSGRATPVGGVEMPVPSIGMPMNRPVAPNPSNPGISRLPFPRDGGWPNVEETRPDINDAFSAGSFNRSKTIWNSNIHKPAYVNTFSQAHAAPVPMSTGPQPVPWSNPRGSVPPFDDASTGYSSGTESYRQDRLTPDPDMMGRSNNMRRGNRFDNRFGSNAGFGGGFGSYNMSYDQTSSYGGNSSQGGNMGTNLFPPYQQQSVNSMSSPLSPHASEFSYPVKSDAGSETQTFMPSTEPLNYRRLLDRNVTCDWKYIVDKIVCNNDQQASIFLQQKLKVGTQEQKYDIVEAIVAQAYPLMINRFGNFLVQRCFEHGLPDQVIKIAQAIRGNTLNLSMDPFGCHVVQKAFDSVPEEYKAIMVHELLRRIPETVIHRYACHVWQKLFELRWSSTPPQIMKHVNNALKDMWHEVALGETGSLVVQNIFENCLEEDKRPCIEEVLANINIVAHGQFGNWCIQHICEHGAPGDRSRAIDHVIHYATEYSMDQFASKVVEKCLKISGPEFLGRYLDRVCEGRLDRPRIPLIDIASDQYGNYLIQYILTHANPQHREIVAAHIRKHMVSLRGSKFGSRVGMLCTNHAVATRPGPGVGPAMGGRMGPGPRGYGGPSYR
jgi:hypothetical protein